MVNNKTAYLLCSTNWPPNQSNPDPNRILSPLRTVVQYLHDTNVNIEKLILLGSGDVVDFDYGGLVKQRIFDNSISPEIDVRAFPDNDPAKISRLLSATAVEARNLKSEVWVDLTSGPKSRAAILLGAASALPDAVIICCESSESGFRVTQIPSLQQYNSWLGPQGLLVRNYKAEIEQIQHIELDTKISPVIARMSDAVSDVLGLNSSEPYINAIGPRTDLTNLAEWIANRAVPQYFLGLEPSNRWQSRNRGETCDADIRSQANSELLRTVARSSQVLYQLRCLFSHPADWTRADVLLFLDVLSYLTESLHRKFKDTPLDIGKELGGDGLYVALDGDDVGRRFEERLADATSLEAALSLRSWSFSVQDQLMRYLFELTEKWRAVFLARTGDGFLVLLDHAALSDIEDQFRPKLPDATVSVGLGPSAKDAYLALKLCKARNRGGGMYFSMEGPEERILWVSS